MVRGQHRPTFKDAIVRIHSLSGVFFGTGCLTFRGLLVTCAHVIEAALDLKDVIGAAPQGRVRVDFPFLPDQPALDAEIADGGWGWRQVKDEKHKPGNDVAILRLLGASPSHDVPSFSPGDVPAGDRKAISHGFTAALYTNGGTVEGRLGSDGLRPDGTYAFDTKDSTHIASPGFSGAPVFIADMPSHIGIPIGMISSKPIVDESDPQRVVRDADRLAFVIPTHRIRQQIDHVLEVETKGVERSSELELASALIPTARASLENVRPINSAQQFQQGTARLLERFEALVTEGLDRPNLEHMVGLIGDLERQLQKAKSAGFEDKLRLLSLQDFCGELAGFGKKVRDCFPEATERCEVPNDWWQDETLPHSAEIRALKASIEKRLLGLDALSISPDTKRHARNALWKLEAALDLDPLPLRIIDQVRQKLEDLDRSVFQDLIIASQLLLGRYTALLPDHAVFRDFREGPQMVVIPAGRFTMGAPDDEEGRFKSEGPPHQVVIPKRFALGRYPVTVREYLNAVEQGGCPSPEWRELDSKYNVETGSEDHYRRLGDALTASDHPIVGVSWCDARAFIGWLAQITSQRYRLPSEAEWEFSCRAEKQTQYSLGDDEDVVDDYAWYDGNSGNKAHAVGTKKPNSFGLHDMHGNVWEWCEDQWHGNYSDKPADLKANGGAWTVGGDDARVLRGGSWIDALQFLRSAYRSYRSSDVRYYDIGFRVARNLLPL